MSKPTSTRVLAAGVTIATVVLLGGAAELPADQSAGKPEAPTPARLLDVPVTHIVPGDIDVKPNIRNPVQNDPDAITRGMKYFANFNCSGCHAANAGGGMGPALSNHSFKFGSDPANLYLTIAQGRPTGMPAWGTLLPSNVIWDLVAYIGSISNAPQDQWGTTTSLEAMTIEQVPAEFKSTPDPWKYTQPFTRGQEPGGN